MSEPVLLAADDVQQKQAALKEDYERKRQLARRAAEERRQRLMALGPEFVQVIKAGQGFTRFSPDGPEEIFVWFDQQPGRSGVLYWEPLAPEGEAQPKLVTRERSLKFASISDIFMGRSTNFLSQFVDKVGIKLCLSFVAHMGSGAPSLHLKARKKLQTEAWMYGVQHILKQGGFHFLEADENLDQKEQEVFQKHTAKQIVRLLQSGDSVIKSLRLQATLNLMNRGQVFQRYLPDNAVTKTLVFFCSDGGRGTLFWGPRAHPEGFLRLRNITDVWLGKHDLLKQSSAAEADASRCVVLVGKQSSLALEAPSSAVMSQWIFGIHSLLTASKEVLETINSAGNREASGSQGQSEKDGSSDAAAETRAAEARAAEVEADEAQAKAKKAVEAGDAAAANELKAAAERASQRAAKLAAEALTSTRIQLNLDDDEDLDLVAALAGTSMDEQTLAAVNEMEAMYEDTFAQLERDREERRKAEAAREAAAQQTREIEQGLSEAGSAAMAAIHAARALRERALAEKQALEEAMTESHHTVEEVLALAAQALGDGDGDGEDDLADVADGPDDYDNDSDNDSDEENTSRPPSTSEGSEDVNTSEDDLFLGGKGGRGRRLSLFSSLDLDDDVKKAFDFDSPTGIFDALDKDKNDDKEDEGSGENQDEGDINGNDDEWTTLMFDVGTSELADAAVLPIGEGEGEVEEKEIATDQAPEGLTEDESAGGENNPLSVAIPEEAEIDDEDSTSGQESSSMGSFKIPDAPASDDESQPRQPSGEPTPTSGLRLSTSGNGPNASLSTPSGRGTTSRASSIRRPSADVSSRLTGSASRLATPTSRLAATPTTRPAASPRVASNLTPGTRPTRMSTTTPTPGVTTPTHKMSTPRTPASGAGGPPSMLSRRGSAGNVSGVTPLKTGGATTSSSTTPRVASLSTRASAPTPTSGATPSGSRLSSTTRPSVRTPGVSGTTSRTTTPSTVGRPGSARTPVPRVAIHLDDTPSAARTPISKR